MRPWFSRHSSNRWPRLSQFQHLSGFRCIAATSFGCISSSSPSAATWFVYKIVHAIVTLQCINSNLSEVLECLISKRTKDSSTIGFRSRATSLSTWNWNSSNGSLWPCLLLLMDSQMCMSVSMSSNFLRNSWQNFAQVKLGFALWKFQYHSVAFPPKNRCKWSHKIFWSAFRFCCANALMR